MTGEAGVGEFAQTAGRASMYSRFSKGSGTRSGQGSEESSEQKILGLSDTSKNNVNDFMNKKEFGEETEKVVDSLEKEGITEVSQNDLESAHDEIMNKIEDGKGLQSNYSDMLASNLINQQRDKGLKAQEERLRSQQIREQIPQTDNWMNESVDVHDDFKKQQESYNSQPINAGHDIPSASSWMSDDVDMYSEIDDKDIKNRSIGDGNPIHGNSISTQRSESVKQPAVSGAANSHQPNIDNSSFDRYEERKNLSTLDLSKQKATVNDYASIDTKNMQSLEDNMPPE